MKHLLLTLLIVLSSTYGFAKDAEVILTRFYTQEEHNIIPDKTDQFQVQNIAFSTEGDAKAIADAISQMVQAINNDDFEHYVFSLYIYPLNDGAYSIQVESHDPMNDPKEMRDNMLGVVKIGYRYFMVQKMPNMEALQKSLFTKAKGKTKFIREFELVPYARRDTRTSILAELENGKLNIKELEICNINKLENPESEAPATE